MDNKEKGQGMREKDKDNVDKRVDEKEDRGYEEEKMRRKRVVIRKRNKGSE